MNITKNTFYMGRPEPWKIASDVVYQSRIGRARAPYYA